MVEKRKGRQTPIQSPVFPYQTTKGLEAVELYNCSGRTALEWQELLCSDIMTSGSICFKKERY